MDEEPEEDIKPDGKPGPEDDGYPQEDGGYPFQPNNEPLDVEENQESPDDVADDTDDVAKSMEAALESVDEGDSTDPEISDSAPPAMPRQQPQQDYGRSPFIDQSQALNLPRGMSLNVSSPPPTAEEMSSISEALDGLGSAGEETGDSFGEQLNEFNDAGGADDGGGGGIPGGDSGDSGGIGQFANSVVNHAQQSDEMLSEYARRLDDLTRRLEAERL